MKKYFEKQIEKSKPIDDSENDTPKMDYFKTIQKGIEPQLFFCLINGNMISIHWLWQHNLELMNDFEFVDSHKSIPRFKKKQTAKEKRRAQFEN